MNTISWKKKAAKQLLGLPKDAQIKIRDAVNGLEHMPNVPQVKMLHHHPYGYRLRVGNYRILFDWDSTIRIVAIEEVRKRDEHTYR